MNYDEIIGAGIDYIDAKNAFRRRCPHGAYITYSNPEICDLYRWLDRAEHALDVIAAVTGISQSVIINAARIENRYYERGGQQMLSHQRLLGR